MLFAKVALIVLSFVLFTAAQDADASSKGLSPGRGRSPNPRSPSRLMTKRDLEKRCTGTCESCFGAGYTECPNSNIFCYLPGDATYGIDSCSSSGSDSTATATASAPASSSTGTSGVDDLCYQTGATCVSCFGPTYLQCPDGYHCYDPSDPLYDTCPDDGTSSSGGNGTTTTSCATQYGAGNIPCGTTACYNPDAGETCCAGGYYCDAGYTCSSTLGKCSIGSGLSGGDTTSSSSYDFGLVTATSTSAGAFGFATTSTVGGTTSAFVFSTASSTATATATGSTSSSSAFSSSGEASGGRALVAGVGRGLLFAMGVVVLVL